MNTRKDDIAHVKKSDLDRVEIRRRVALQLAEARERTGLSQAELAEEVGVSRQTISNIETGAKLPRTKTIAKILVALGYNIDPPQFDTETESWLVTIGTLIEELPHPRRQGAVNRVVSTLADELRVSGMQEDYDLAADADDGGGIDETPEDA